MSRLFPCGVAKAHLIPIYLNLKVPFFLYHTSIAHSYSCDKKTNTATKLNIQITGQGPRKSQHFRDPTQEEAAPSERPIGNRTRAKK